MAFPRQLNPFDKIIFFQLEKPHRHTINSNFKTKIKDAFNVISGTAVDKSFRDSKVGLLGWATLFIPWAIEMGSFYIATKSLKKMKALYDSNNKLPLKILGLFFLGLGVFLSGLIGLALAGARLLISAILTVASMPIIAMVAGISALVKKHYENKLLDSTVTVEVIEGTNVRSSRESTLREALAETKTPIQSLFFPQETEDTYKFHLLEKTITLDTTNSDIKDAAKNLNLIPVKLVKFD